MGVERNIFLDALKRRGMKKLMLLVCCSLGLWLTTLYGCKKDKASDSKPEATLSMRLTDGPAAYDAIWLDIRSVEVTMAGWPTLTMAPIRPGLYNLLDFRNGMDTLLFTAPVPAGDIGQIRLILGENNSIVVDGVTHPLSTPSAQESGVKLNLHQTLTAGGAYDIWLDFDAAKSIVVTGNGTYKLKPVIRAYSALTNGRVKGYVLPLNALAVVYAIQGTDTFSAIPDPLTGYFRFGGLPDGAYNIWIDANLPGLQDTTITGVQVNFGTETDLGTLTLHP